MEVVVPTKHKLAHLRDLEREMRSITLAAEQCIAEGQDKATTQLIAAEAAVRHIAGMLQDLGIEAGPLVWLDADLLALREGSKPSEMLQPAKTDHRRADPPLIAALKGRIAAITEHAQRLGVKRKEAPQWVLHRIPASLCRKLNLKSPSTINNWLTNCGGAFGTPSYGREGYEIMRRLLTERKFGLDQLADVIAILDRKAPA
jgi:hypothetical protein